MKHYYFAIFVAATSWSSVDAQLPEVVSLNFTDPAHVSDNPWIYVAPTPLGVSMADPNTTLEVDGNNWVWSLNQPGEVLVGIFADSELRDSSVEAAISFDAASENGFSIGFLNRFGAVPNPDPAGNPLGHGYCTLVSPDFITIIDFDFARDQDDYVRAIAQIETPDGLFTGATTDVLFQTIDATSQTDPSQTLPTFDFWLGGTQIFDDVQDPNASWSDGFSGIDVWSIDPFAQATTESLTVNVDSLSIRGVAVPEPNCASLAFAAGLGVLFFRRRA